jgi:uncharacterized damage-inducible protein DinB
MHTIETVRDLHAWMRWCTGRTVEAARALSADELRREFPMGLSSVLGTLVHLCWAEKLWLCALKGTPSIPMATAKDYASIDALMTEWTQVRSDWDAFLNALTDTELNRVVIRVREGKEYKQRVLDGLLQLPTHALYHNAQMSAMFRQMGHSLPDSSYILWARDRMAAEVPVNA